MKELIFAFLKANRAQYKSMTSAHAAFVSLGHDVSYPGFRHHAIKVWDSGEITPAVTQTKEIAEVKTEAKPTKVVKSISVPSNETEVATTQGWVGGFQSQIEDALSNQQSIWEDEDGKLTPARKLYLENSRKAVSLLPKHFKVRNTNSQLNAIEN